MNERIRTRAYFKWLSREGTQGLPEADWLAAEEEELFLFLAATAKAAIPKPSVFSQDDLWLGAAKLAELFGLLSSKLRRKRMRSYFLAMIERYQDYLTSSQPVSDEESVRVAADAFRIWRLLNSFIILAEDDLSAVAFHSLRKELKDVFSESEISFNTSEFNLYAAASIRLSTGLQILFIDEDEHEGTSPDLEVDGLAYIECKDIQTLTRSSLSKALEDNLMKAVSQLREAQDTRPLHGSGICIDTPPKSLPLTANEWDVVRTVLDNPEGPDFIWISCSGFVKTPTHAGWPVATCLVWRQSGEHLFDQLLRHLGRSSYKMQPGYFEQIPHSSRS